MTKLFDPNESFSKIAFTDVERVRWTSRDGDLNVSGHLIYPKNYRVGHKYPLVVVTFSPEGFLRGGRGNEYPVHVLAAAGFMVLVFQRSWQHDYVHEPGWTYSEESRAEINATLEQGISLPINRGDVDERKIAVTGLSDGGEIAQWALSRGHVQYAAGIVSTQNVAPFDYYFLSKANRVMMGKVFGVQFTIDGPHGGVFDTMPPTRFVEHMNAPLLFNLPESEVLGAANTFATMQEYGKPCEVYLYPGEFHVKWQPLHRYNIYRRNTQWLQFWLEDREVDDPVDPQQYIRWRGLRETRQIDRGAALQDPVRVVGQILYEGGAE